MMARTKRQTTLQERINRLQAQAAAMEKKKTLRETIIKARKELAALRGKK